jgi:biofilm PGA synthesis lipoprotein PgaB
VVVGLLALPLSVVPFLAYGTFTPEGRLVRDRLVVAVSPPGLPELPLPLRLLATAAAPRYQHKVMALVYHGIGSSDGEGGFVVSPRRFGEHLGMLRAAGMHAVTAAEVADAFAGGTPLPDNAVMISFDDGRSDALLWADPLLAAADMRATMFVIGSAASSPGVYYAGWDRLRAAARSGRWDIQAHSDASHREQQVAGGGSLPVLTSLAPGESLAGYRQRVAADLERNSGAIRKRIGRRPVALAYPFGAYGADRVNDPGIRRVLAEEVARRFTLAFHQDEQDTIPLLDPAQDRIGLRRLEVGNWTGHGLLERIDRAAGGAGGPLPAGQAWVESPRGVRHLADLPAATGPPVPATAISTSPATGPPPTATARRLRPRPRRPSVSVPTASPAERSR